MMVYDGGIQVKPPTKKGAEFRQQVIPEIRCNDGYGSVGEHEMRIDRGRERVRQDRASLLDGEKFETVNDSPDFLFCAINNIDAGVINVTNCNYNYYYA